MKCIDSSVIFPSNHVTNRSGQQATVRFGAGSNPVKPDPRVVDAFVRLFTGTPAPPTPQASQGPFRRFASSLVVSVGSLAGHILGLFSDLAGYLINRFRKV